MDLTAQILLSLMILVLGATLTLVGIQFYLLLKELRESVKKTNLILENAQNLSLALTEGSSKLKESLGGFLSFMVLAKTLVEKFRQKSKS